MDAAIYQMALVITPDFGYLENTRITPCFIFSKPIAPVAWVGEMTNYALPRSAWERKIQFQLGEENPDCARLHLGCLTRKTAFDF